MKRDYRLVNVKGTPMLIFDNGEMISDDIVKYGDYYEYFIFNSWHNLFPTEGLLLDIGANIGNHALQFKHYLPNIEIWCFEPYFENFKLLRQNIKQFKDVKSFNIGVGSRTSVVTFSDDHQGNSGIVRIVPDGNNTNMVVRIDDINFTNKKISMIKLDVEGHEYSVIEGAFETIKKHKPMIWIEDFTMKTVNMLLTMGYKLFKEERESNFLMIYE